MKHLLSKLTLLGIVSLIFVSCSKNSEKLYLVCKKSNFETLDIVIDPFLKKAKGKGWVTFFIDDKENIHNTTINGKHVHLYQINSEEIKFFNMWVDSYNVSFSEGYTINRYSGQLIYNKNDDNMNSLLTRTYSCETNNKKQF